MKKYARITASILILVFICSTTSVYKGNAKTLARQQVALAGARLAKILNDELR
jgi:hypothetical protein